MSVTSQQSLDSFVDTLCMLVVHNFSQSVQIGEGLADDIVHDRVHWQSRPMQTRCTLLLRSYLFYLT
jgi:hypothetical protein